MEKIGNMTGGLLTLVAASTISIADFETKVKSYLPQISMNQLKHDKKNATKSTNLTEEQLKVFDTELSVMAEVNAHTQDVFLPALEANFQRWAKEDIHSLKNAIVWIQKALESRLKQYDVLATLFKKSKAPSSIVKQVEQLKTDSKRSQEHVRALKSKLAVMEEALTLFKESQNTEQGRTLEDFWIPAISTEEKNVLIVSEKRIQSSHDYDSVNAMEVGLQNALMQPLKRSVYFSSIVLG